MADKYQNYEGIIIGYYRIRGKAQVCRLLCEYLHLPYLDMLFTPQTWEEFKRSEAVKWNYQQMPFLKHKDFVITETFTICQYLINKANRLDLLGLTISDQALVDMFVWDTQIMSQILSLMISVKNETMDKKKETFSKFWQENLRERLIKLEQQASETFYLPYLTIVDFYCYDIIYFFKIIAPKLLEEFPKLQKISTKVANLPEIASYQSSTKAIKDICPQIFCEKWKQKCSMMKGQCPTSSCTGK